MTMVPPVLTYAASALRWAVSSDPVVASSMITARNPSSGAPDSGRVAGAMWTTAGCCPSGRRMPATEFEDGGVVGHDRDGVLDVAAE